MTDQELLEAAARAAGILWVDGEPSRMGYAGWNPLTNDGDALQLAVSLKLNIIFSGPRRFYVGENQFVMDICEELTTDPVSDIRRAIVRAAASMDAK